MAELKTKRTGASVTEYIDARANEAQRADCKALIVMLRRVTGKPPKMWGPSIVGFGSFKYRYETGRTGEIALAAFAIRGRDLVLYLLPDAKGQAALRTKLGPHSMGKSCLYFRRLADLDSAVLEQLVRDSMTEALQLYPQERK
jgi:hypothetical protein